MLKLATGLAVLALATAVAAQPYGSGMMGGAGPGGWGGGYGPGMMGGWGGGYGPGMMGGGMGPGMMWGPGGGALADLDLSKEQRDKIAEIQGEVRRQHWAMMRGMQQQEWHMADAWRDDGSFDVTRWECRPWYEVDGSIGGIVVYTEVYERRDAAGARLPLRPLPRGD